jgi:hypothetical protein
MLFLPSPLNYERDQRAAAGCACDNVCRVCSFFFATRNGVRMTLENYCRDLSTRVSAECPRTVSGLWATFGDQE